MSGAVLEYTLHYNLEIPNFDFPNWHTYYARTLKSVDGLIYMISGVTNVKGPWQNATSYVANDRVVDIVAVPAAVYVCNTPHVSIASPGTFATDRAAHPAYWTISDFASAQPLNANLTALSTSAAPTADQVIYFTSGSTTAPFTVTTNARTLLAISTYSGMRTQLGLQIGANVQAWDTDLDWLAANLTAAGQALLDDANATAQRTTLGATAIGDAIFTAANTLAVRTQADIAGGYPKTVALADGASVALDASLGDTFTLLAAGDRTIAVPTNPKRDGDRIIIRHTASGGNRTLSLNTGANGFRFTADVSALTITNTGIADYIGCVWNASAAKWDVVSYTKGA